jgi:large subunit ribosomal protein L9
MKLILRADVRDLGRSGELVEVKDGYARNYLLPRSLAVPASAGNLKDFQKRIAVAKEREEKERAAANKVADELRGKRIVIIHRSVEGGTRIHGSVTTQDVAQAILEQTGHTIERRDIDVRKPIRSLGDYQVNLKLMRGLTVPVQLLVTDREPSEETPEPDAAAAAEEETPVETEEAPAGAA